MQNNMLMGTFGSFITNSWMDNSGNLFSKALAAGRNHKLISMLTRRSSRLLDLSSYQSLMKNGRYAGLREVSLDDIRGTEGRLNDFDDHFNPLTDRTSERWLSIARANNAGIGLPPVELIQVDEVYFVRDGHHRISVARAIGQSTITAAVTVW